MCQRCLKARNVSFTANRIIWNQGECRAIWRLALIGSLCSVSSGFQTYLFMCCSEYMAWSKMAKGLHCLPCLWRNYTLASKNVSISWAYSAASWTYTSSLLMPVKEEARWCLSSQAHSAQGCKYHSIVFSACSVSGSRHCTTTQLSVCWKFVCLMTKSS